MRPRANRWATAIGLGAFAVCLFAAGHSSGARTGGPAHKPASIAAQLGSDTVPPAAPATSATGVSRSSGAAANTGRTTGTAPLAVQPPPTPPDALGTASTSSRPLGAVISPANAKLVRFVYFVESDESYDAEAVALIERQARALQQLWYDQFGGTFVMADDVTVLYGLHQASWYDGSPAGEDPRWYRLTNIRDEVRRDLGLGPDDTSVRFVVYPNARIDGRVGANRYGGAVMDGDDVACISGRVTTTPYSADYPANCLSTVAHELGHVFGLTHQGPDEDCMQFGFYQYVNRTRTCQFSADNRSLVINDPNNQGWLTSKPGDTTSR